jgi:transcriptional regulator with XRE-family HTH domain
VNNRIKVIRVVRGLSLDELAERVGTTNQQISHLEGGKRRLTVDWLIRLSKALACHPWELVSDDLPKPLRSKDIRLLERFRLLNEAQQDALIHLLSTFPVTRRARIQSK